MLSSLNAAAVISCAAMLSIIIACLNSFYASCAALAVALLALFLQPSNIRAIARKLAVINIFIIFIWLIVPFTTPGPSLWHWRFINISETGIDLCVLATFKANAIACVFLLLIAPLPISVIGSGLYSLRCPEKLIWLFLLMGRNIQILKKEWHSLITATKLRGFRAGATLNSYRTIASLLALLLARAQRRGQRVYEAMLLRGFSGKLPCRKINVMKPSDYVFMLIVFICISVIIGLEVLCGQ